MSDTVTTRYIYPPNWDGFYEASDIGHQRYTVQLTCVSDGTGESDVRKIIVADHLNREGATATSLVIEEIRCVGYGFTSLTLSFDRDPEVTLAVIGDTETYKYRREGGLADNGVGGTGDVFLTSAGANSGDTYDLTIIYRVK